MNKAAICVSALAVTAVLGCSTTGTSSRTQLSAAEVRETFIGTPWRNNEGTFRFDPGGTYIYSYDGKTLGPWEYTMSDAGVLTGATTKYTFYRTENGNYQYYHSRSRRYLPAFVGG